MKYNLEEIVNHLKTQGFVFPGSEIYGGLANAWDYGPLGVALINNLKKIWWDFFITKSKYNLGLDSAILMNNNVWLASGHLQNFSDPLVDCRECKSRFRADKLLENVLPTASQLSTLELQNAFTEFKIICPECNKQNFTEIRNFNLMFKTYQGVVEKDKSEINLRPETAQGIFVNFKNVQRAMRKKLPFGIGQIGKSFRNEITPGNFIFRTREFEQMELEFFFAPNDKFDWFNYWVNQVTTFLDVIGISSDNYVIREHSQEELAHYAQKTVDIEYLFPFGKQELWGIAHRTDYDLKQHSEYSHQDLRYCDQTTGEKFFPYVIEPSVGVGRLMLAILCESFDREKINDNDYRTVLKLPLLLAPYYVAILPLSKQLNEDAFNLYEQLLTNFSCSYDETGNIGKRYRRQDAIGTPFCVTVDFETNNDHKVTIRFRDSMQQERILITELSSYLTKLAK